MEISYGRQRRKEQHKEDMMLTRIFLLTKKKRAASIRFPIISWEEMRVPFQHYMIGDLHQRGMVAYASGGFYLKEIFWEATLEELKQFRDEKVNGK